MEVLIELLLELFGGLLMEGLAELISRFWVAVAQEQPNPSIVHLPRAIVCQLAGIAAGAISLLFTSQHIIHSPTFRLLNLVFTPVLMALALVAWGRYLQRHDRDRTPLNRFVCAYGFAICYMLVRFFFAR
ncbi:MAG: hypothetical protein JWN40_256 [Phycisphaerales bacterium]|nr:hypothetical protein [Phycisphaerales bacterium]